MKNKKSIFSMLLLLCLLGITIAVVLQSNDITNVLSAIVAVHPLWFVAGALLSLACVALEGIIIWYLLKSMQAPSKIAKCIKWSFIGFFFSGITPSTTGGQPAQVYQMSKDGVKVADSTLTLMVVAMLGKVVTLLIGLALALFWHSSLVSVFGGLLWLFYLGLGLNAIFVAGISLAIANPAIFISVASVAERLLVRMHILKPSDVRRRKLENMLAEYRQALSYLIQNKKKVLVVAGITLAQRTGMFLVTWIVHQSLGLGSASIPTIVALQAAVSIATELTPLPGAVGVTELVYSTVFAGVLSGSLLTASMLVTRGINYYLPLAIGLCVTAGTHLYDKKSEKSACPTKKHRTAQHY